VILSTDRMPDRWPSPHICQECPEGSPPSQADANATPSVSGIVSTQRVQATLLDALPDAIHSLHIALHGIGVTSARPDSTAFDVPSLVRFLAATNTTPYYQTTARRGESHNLDVPEHLTYHLLVCHLPSISEIRASHCGTRFHSREPPLI